MNYSRRFLVYLFLIFLGAVLMILGYRETIDSFWSGMGSGLMGVSLVRMVQLLRLSKDAAYREKVETEVKDERNAFLRARAWAWAGYLFILISAVAVIVLKVMGQDLLSQAASYAVCLLLALYWGAYLLLRRKY